MVDVPVDHPGHEDLAQSAAEARLAACYDFMWHWDERGDHSEDECEDCPTNVSCAPFCGCDTCMVREVLDAAAPYMVTNVALDVGTVKQGTVCVVRTDSPLPACVSDALRDTLIETTSPTALIILGPGIDIDALDDDDMAAMGWRRS